MAENATTESVDAAVDAPIKVQENVDYDLRGGTTVGVRVKHTCRIKDGYYSYWVWDIFKSRAQNGEKLLKFISETGGMDKFLADRWHGHKLKRRPVQPKELNGEISPAMIATKQNEILAMPKDNPIRIKLCSLIVDGSQEANEERTMLVAAEVENQPVAAEEITLEEHLQIKAAAEDIHRKHIAN